MRRMASVPVLRSGPGVAQLAASGHPVNLAFWNERNEMESVRLEKKPTLTVPICGANYVMPKQAKPSQAMPPSVGRASESPRPALPVANGTNGQHGPHPNGQIASLPAQIVRLRR